MKRLKIVRQAASSCAYWESWLASKGCHVEYLHGWLVRIMNESEAREYDAITLEM
jgi:hypothetical protein